jgi:hypothetical protein
MYQVHGMIGLFLIILYFLSIHCLKSNSVFPQIPKRIKRKRKKNKYLPINNNNAEFQLALEKYCRCYQLNSK